MRKLIALLFLFGCSQAKYKIDYSVTRYLEDSRYTLELIPAEIIVYAKAYKNNKLCYQTKVQQKFYIEDKFAAKHSSQWQAQTQALKNKARAKILFAARKQGVKFCT